MAEAPALMFEKHFISDVGKTNDRGLLNSNLGRPFLQGFGTDVFPTFALAMLPAFGHAVLVEISHYWHTPN